MTDPRDPRNAVAARNLRLGEDGQALLEFSITFPWVLLTCLSVLQLSLMYAAQSVVDYAAFCAARSACVYVPRSQVLALPGVNNGKNPNEVDDFTRFGRIHIAAALPLTVISPTATAAGQALPPFAPFFRFASSIISGLPANVQNIVGGVDRFAYAYAAVSLNAYGAGISVSDSPSRDELGTGHTLPQSLFSDDRGDIYVKVTYLKFLEIPFINYALGQVFPRMTNRPINQATRIANDPDVNFYPITGYARVPNEGFDANEPNLAVDFWNANPL